MSNNLEYYRVQIKGISQRELAEQSGISTVTICSLESGVIVTPRNKTMKAIAAALGQSVAPHRFAYQVPGNHALALGPRVRRIGIRRADVRPQGDHSPYRRDGTLGLE